ncbi:IS3 family transposase [Paenibacillus cellulosilyticus]|uniref:IS3 family transposase n=1 Tax=Paenibacillus cellulosilyticus TaxID=375489 RepID=UPI003CCC895F
MLRAACGSEKLFTIEAFYPYRYPIDLRKDYIYFYNHRRPKRKLKKLALVQYQSQLAIGS